MIGLPRPAAAAVIMAMGKVGIGVRAQFAAFVHQPRAHVRARRAARHARRACSRPWSPRPWRPATCWCGSTASSTAPRASCSSHWLTRLLARRAGAAPARPARPHSCRARSSTHRGPALVGVRASSARSTSRSSPRSSARTKYFGNDDLRWFAADPARPARAGRRRARVTHRLVGACGDRRFAVVVPTYARPDALARCLDALADQRRAFDEVVVVTRDRRRRRCRGRDRPLGDAVHGARSSTRRGVLAAMAAGARATTTDVVCFTDDDAVPPAEWLERLAATLRGAPTRGRRRGPRRDRRGRTAPRATSRAPTTSVASRGSGATSAATTCGEGPPRDVAFLKGVNAAYRRDALGLPDGLRGARRPGALRGRRRALRALARLPARLRPRASPSSTVRPPRQGDDQRDGPTARGGRRRRLQPRRRDRRARRGSPASLYATLVGDRGRTGPRRAPPSRSLRGDRETVAAARAVGPRLARGGLGAPAATRRDLRDLRLSGERGAPAATTSSASRASATTAGAKRRGLGAAPRREERALVGRERRAGRAPPRPPRRRRRARRRARRRRAAPRRPRRRA